MNPAVVSSILNCGSFVNTKIISSNIWCQNIVYKCENNTVCIPLVENYLQNFICIGSRIVIKYSNEFFEYLFEGTVSAIRPEHPSYITVSIQKAEELVNVRTFLRYDIHLPSDLKPRWDNSKYFAVVVNICLGGVAFYCSHEFDCGEESEVWIYMQDGRSIYGRGKIVRKYSKNNLYNYSMQFIDMTEENSIILSDYLAQLDEDAASIQAHFFNNIKKLL